MAHEAVASSYSDMPDNDQNQPERDEPERQGHSPDSSDRLFDRRTLIKSGLLAGGALAGGGAALANLVSGPGPAASHLHKASRGPKVSPSGAPATVSRRRRARKGHVAPNILVVMVDQMRTPQWYSAAALMPHLASLRKDSVSFDSHYTASNDCTPARSTMLTGLYTHQTGCMITGGSTLDPGFPTWGTMLREHGYRTWWYGKWHLTHGDNHWDGYLDAGALEPYGFSGGTYPSPDGGPGQGWRTDPHIVTQFEEWYARAPTHEPWCTTVSFVNPHDIAWWYRWSDRTAAESSAPSLTQALPPNFETPDQLLARGKPRLQRSLQETAGASFGKVPYTGPEVQQAWLPFLDLYLKLLGQVDSHIGQVLRTLASRPHVAANTIVVFTSDHGEYGASHGLRGKGAAVYEEAIRVPLMVRDPRGRLTKAPASAREGLTSSVDVAPMLLGIATGSESWREDSHYSHLAERHDLLSMLGDPTAPGRPHVLHATDEVVTEFAIEPYAATAPLHVAAIRTPHAKYATYSNFQPGTIKARASGQERELYDYSTRAGRLEIDNVAGGSAIEEELGGELERAVREEMRKELPRRLHAAHRRGLADYFDTAARSAVKVSERRKLREERQLEGPESPFSQSEGQLEVPLEGDSVAKRSARRRAGRAKTRRRTRL